MNLKRGKYWVAIAALSLSGMAAAVTVTPQQVSMAAGASQTVKVSSVSGTLSVSSAKTSTATVTKVDSTTYRINGVAQGSTTVQFKDRKNTAKVTVSVTAAAPSAGVLEGRLLASNCFQCHGTNGTGGFDRLAGKSASEIYNELREFASGKEDAGGIMAAHAMGFTDAQLKSIASYFASVR